MDGDVGMKLGFWLVDEALEFRIATDWIRNVWVDWLGREVGTIIKYSMQVTIAIHIIRSVLSQKAPQRPCQ